MKKNAIVGQSGGPTAVINASACAVIETARAHPDKIGKVFAGRNGIVGALDLSEIVLSGPHELLEGPLTEATVETLRARTLAEFHDGVQVRMTAEGQDIVLRGAAVMVLSGQLGVS